MNQPTKEMTISVGVCQMPPPTHINTARGDRIIYVMTAKAVMW
jgi:hypothetical protein